MELRLYLLDNEDTKERRSVARFYLSVEVLIGEFDQTVVGYRKFVT